MEDERALPRRRLLGGVAGVIAGGLLAGCNSSDESNTDDGESNSEDTGGTDPADGDPTEEDTDGSGTTDDERESGGSETTDGLDDGSEGDAGTPQGTDDAGSDPADLDLREANVVDVAFDGGDGSYEFDVTLHHDDDGEEGFANWWQVERPGGEQLGRRELLHAHSNQPFTRSETIDVPDDVPCVVVRGHDQTHGYGGRAVLVNLDSGGMRAVDQGPEPESFAASDCP